MTRRNMSMDDILFGIGHGRRQTVGNMDVIPLVDEGADRGEEFMPPTEVEVGTEEYGTVSMRHSGDSPTVMPTGSCWVVKERAQDHAIGSGVLLAPGDSKTIRDAMCIQSSQSGMIRRQVQDLTILPVGLRTRALALRGRQDYSKLWGSIGEFNKGYGSSDEQALVYFLRNFGKQLDQFVAEFELVPGQVGAIILVNGKLVGVEVAPNSLFWESIWEPMIRVCYGSFAIRYADQAAPTRRQLDVSTKTLDGLWDAYQKAAQDDHDRTELIVGKVREDRLLTGTIDQAAGGYEMKTVGSPGGTELAGQIVQRAGHKAASYLSMCVKVD